jgi:hypothetical protein
VKFLRASDRSRKGRTFQKELSALAFRHLAVPTGIAWCSCSGSPGLGFPGSTVQWRAHSLRASGNRRTLAFG